MSPSAKEVKDEWSVARARAISDEAKQANPSHRHTSVRNNPYWMIN
jgi:hypothetical protein